MKNIKDLHHSIESFGILKVTMSGIRVEKIPDRIIPAVPFPHKHDFFQIMLVTKGSGKHQIDFKKYTIKENQIFIMKPGQVHSWNLNKSIDGYIIEFNRESLQVENFGETDLLNRIQFLPDVLNLKKSNIHKSINKMAEVMYEEFQGKAELHDICLRNYLSGLMVQLIRESQIFEVEQKKTFTNPELFRMLVEKYFRTEHRVEFYASKLKMSPKALTMQVSRAFGKSPRYLIQERFIMEAKRYLAFSGLSIAQIGHELGFQDANYFSRFFKNHEKVTPGDFRKTLKTIEVTA